MSVLDIDTDIPNQINTLERLTAWCGYSLAFCNPQVSVVETQSRVEAAAQAMIFQAADDTYRLLVRACLPISPSYMSDRTIKLWQHTQEIGNAVIPAGFKSN